jgi:hypothetical protein
MDMSAATPHQDPKRQSLSHLLRDLSDNAGEKITLGEIADGMEHRSFGAFLVVFCLPNLIPLPPGATFILGLPLVFVAFQMAFSRRDTIWLPRRLHEYAFDNRAFAKVLDKFLPWIGWTERFVKPRFWMGDTRLYERFLGVFALLLALIIFLPIPLGNMGPAYALALMGLGLTERDGLVMAAGVAIGVIFTAIISYVGYEIITAIPGVIRHLPVYWASVKAFFTF